MRYFNKVIAGCTILGGFAAGGAMMRLAAGAQAVAADPAGQPADELAALKADVARLKNIAHDQSHAMADVGYHYSNLWFAGQNENWPLARFYFDEARAHLRWAVRIIPIRKDSAGREVDLNGILTALDQTTLKDLDETLKEKDKSKFTVAYKAQLENCMACHRAVSKEYIRLHVPEHPDANIVDFRPEQARQ